MLDCEALRSYFRFFALKPLNIEINTSYVFGEQPMNDRQTRGKRNLTILSWLGLACQAFGVLVAFGSMIGVVGSAEDTWRGIISGMVSVVFGMALSGWAGNLIQITELKNRVAELEGQAPNNESRP